MHHGLIGAMQPWESALLGFGVSSWADADEHEIHITGDVPMAFRLCVHPPLCFVDPHRVNGCPLIDRPASPFFFLSTFEVARKNTPSPVLTTLSPHRYYRMSRNETWLRERGWEMARDSANFFASRVVPDPSKWCRFLLLSGFAERNV